MNICSPSLYMRKIDREKTREKRERNRAEESEQEKKEAKALFILIH